MPDENMPEELDESYKAEPVEKPAEEKPAEKTVDEENAGAPEILVSKNKLPAGTKEGATCTFKVVKDFGDEFSLEVVKAPKGDYGETTKENLESETEKEISALDIEG